MHRNCRVLGVTAMETSVALVTVSIVDPLMAPDVAAMVVVPTVSPVAEPVEPPLEMEATPAADEDHVTCVVRSCVVASV